MPREGPERMIASGAEATRGAAGGAVLMLGALGVVFGDIGTSPLYALREAFSPEHDLRPDAGSVYGVLSLIFWAITIVVTIKYVLFITRADNHGEGGIMALISLVQQTAASARGKYLLVALGTFGAALFYGDGMITPAISVLSAVEGLEVVSPGLKTFVVPITLVVLTSLFAIQRFGTGAVGRLFGPIMLTWFLAMAAAGLGEVVTEPGVLRALSPTYAVTFLAEHGEAGFLALGSVVLAVTGAEALYADMGHFGAPSIRAAWGAVVLPALLLNYFGQGALLLGDASAASSPFYRLVPAWGQIPMVVLATLAAIIASQAVISGAYSVTRQAMQLGFLPFLRIRHTSEQEVGQIYLPGVNWLLFAAVVALVVGFGSSSALASAYGIAVTGTLAIDTILAFVVVRMLWHKPLWMVFAGAAFFLVVDLGFFAANVPKIPSGGWFPLVTAVIIYTVLRTWRRGRETVARNRREEEGELRDFVLALQETENGPVRVPLDAVYLQANVTTTPLALRFNVEHNQVLHEHAIILSAETVGVPHVDDAERLEIDDVLVPDDGIVLVTAKFGFQDVPDLPGALRLAADHGVPVDVDRASWFLSRITVHPTKMPGMAAWRKRLYTVISRNAASPAEHFRLPEDRVVSLGSAIDL
jgi:KUP system potassium uptake protein